MSQVPIVIETSGLPPSWRLPEFRTDELVNLGLCGCFHRGLDSSKCTERMSASETGQYIFVIGRISVVDADNVIAVNAAECNLI